MIGENYKPKINPRNEMFANQLRDLAKQYNIIGVVDVEGLPAPQFQRIRATISKTAKVLIVKKNLISLVLKELEKTHPGISALNEKMAGVVGLIFTNDNPFTLYKFVKKNKSSAPAKAGSIAPCDVVVPAGPTNFAPGPIIGELGAFKIKAGIAAGKVEIKADAVVAKEGEVINGALAGILTRLGIEPMEVGLNIKAIFENETLYNRDVLDVDEEAILNNLKAEAFNCFKLSIGLNYYTSENIAHFIGNVSRDSLGLGVGIAYPAAETISRLLAKANSQGSGVAMVLPEDIRPAGVSAPVAASVSNANASDNEGPKEEKKEEAPADSMAGFGNFF